MRSKSAPANVHFDVVTSQASINGVRVDVHDCRVMMDDVVGLVVELEIPVTELICNADLPPPMVAIPQLAMTRLKRAHDDMFMPAVQEFLDTIDLPRIGS